jgi:hypothetical protein
MTVIGLVTIGQSPRTDVVPDMAAGDGSRRLAGVPVLLVNLLVARVIAELSGA